MGLRHIQLQSSAERYNPRSVLVGTRYGWSGVELLWARAIGLTDSTEEEKMFIGHFGAGFAAKPVARQTSLGTLFFAAQFIDLLWPTLLLLGLESVRIVPGATKVTPLEFTHYPISHSLFAVVVWSVLFGAVYYLVRRSVQAAIVCGGLVASHWFFDALTHQPDLPLAPGGSSRIGLGLWNSPVMAISVELFIFAVGLTLYLRATRPTDRIGSIALWGLVAFLLVVYVMNLFGPPPPSVEAIAWTAQAQWLLVIWAYWVDRHRRLDAQ